MTRQEANRRLVAVLAELVETQPGLRFSQLLYAAGVVVSRPITCHYLDYGWVDEYHLEPEVLLTRVETNLEKLPFLRNDK